MTLVVLTFIMRYVQSGRFILFLKPPLPWTWIAQPIDQGVAASEVEVDCLTGDAKVLRADILMDIGTTINPAIDIGQIEGAFIQVR